MGLKDDYNWDFVFMLLGLALVWFLIFLGVNAL